MLKGNTWGHWKEDNKVSCSNKLQIIIWDRILHLRQLKCSKFQTIICWMFENTTTHSRLTQNTLGWYKSHFWWWAINYLHDSHPLGMRHFCFPRFHFFLPLKELFYHTVPYNFCLMYHLLYMQRFDLHWFIHHILYSSHIHSNLQVTL